VAVLTVVTEALLLLLADDDRLTTVPAFSSTDQSLGLENR
jgi:hypothetical protein